MAKRRKNSIYDSPFTSGGQLKISPQGYLGRLATGDGRRKNKSKNVDRWFGG